MDWPYDDFPGDRHRTHLREPRIWEDRMVAQRCWRQDRLRRQPFPPFSRRRPLPLPMTPAPTFSSTQPPKSLDEATVFLVNHLNMKKDKITALIQHLRFQEERGASLAHMLPSWFKQLGTTVFAGQITPQNVRLRGREFRQRDRPGRTYVPGVHPHSNTIEIHIHTRLLLANRRHVHVGTQAMALLLHQMIHAYFLVACGPQTDGKDPDGRLKHGEHFSCIMYKIKELSGARGISLLLDFGHNIPYRPYLPGHEARFSGTANSKIPEYTCSDCTATSEGIEEVKVKDWYKNKCVKALNPDIFEYKATGKPVATPLSKCGDTKKWVEVSYNKKPYKVDRPCVDKYASLKKIFEGEKRKLKIPTGVEEEVFECLMRFLASGTYGQFPAVTKNGTKGPAIIQDIREQWPPFIMTEIKLYQLCNTLGFIELRRIAMKRLNDQHVCHEDPADILKAIYGPERDPDKDLRTWAKRFMKCWTPTPGKSPIDTSNWMKLSNDGDLQDQMDYRHGLCHPLLRIDFDGVGEELKEMECAPLPTPPPPTTTCMHIPPQPLIRHPHFQTTAQPQYHTSSQFVFGPDAMMNTAFQTKFQSPLRSWAPHDIEMEMQRRAQHARFDPNNWLF